ncbi:hypothetical protein FHR20_003129 [Sphingomonas leidyi]|uniref:eCIS core domain-containing protein n=1 Tax=Sphingomonas leidyi TaxID=68569 RepID=A0A7X5V2S1_9SPHN|nr:DUF4157 domain-containing protein [Sphingomonas leidyi]NIJ66167.1 hypothetical protein [Sphingomonas leidyi]
MQAPFRHRPMDATHGPGGRADAARPAAVQRAATPGRWSTAANIAAPRETIADYAASHALGVSRTAAGPNRTGLPDRLKSSMESLSGIALDDVRVHRNSARPAQLRALAHTQGSEIHLGPGQERHLAHEAWHVVQQKQGRVRPTMRLGGTAINDDAGLEREADTMGIRAARPGPAGSGLEPGGLAPVQRVAGPPVVQRAIGYEVEVGDIRVTSTTDAPPVKGQVLWTGPGWDASVDEVPLPPDHHAAEEDDGEAKEERAPRDPGSVFDLEFRTKPIDDVTPGGRKEAQKILTAIAAQWNAVQKSYPHRYAGAPPGVDIRPTSRSCVAQVQASVGLSLDGLRRMRSGEALRRINALVPEDANVTVRDALAEGGTADRAIAEGVEAHKARIRAALHLPGHVNIDNLCAVIGMIVNVPVAAAQGGLLYPKSAAGPLMARSNFTTILRQLPPDQLRAIQNNRVAWTNVLLAITRAVIGEEDEEEGAPVFPEHAFSKPNDKTHHLSQHLSRRDWFSGLANDEDRLTGADYQARHGNQDAADELESLGGYGTKLDASSYSISGGGYAAITLGVAGMVAGIAATLASGGLAGGLLALGGLGTAALGYSKGTKPNRTRPIFELRSLGRVYADDLVEAGLIIWDYVAQANTERREGD